MALRVPRSARPAPVRLACVHSEVWITHTVRVSQGLHASFRRDAPRHEADPDPSGGGRVATVVNSDARIVDIVACLSGWLASWRTSGCLPSRWGGCALARAQPCTRRASARGSGGLEACRCPLLAWARPFRRGPPNVLTRRSLAVRRTGRRPLWSGCSSENARPCIRSCVGTRD